MAKDEPLGQPRPSARVGVERWRERLKGQGVADLTQAEVVAYLKGYWDGAHDAASYVNRVVTQTVTANVER